MKNYLKNYFSTAIFIITGYLFFKFNPFYSNLISNQSTFINTTVDIIDVFNYVLYFYLIMLIPFYLMETGVSKARITLSTIGKKIKNNSYQISSSEKTAILSWIVKLFFIPLMITWIVQNGASMVNNIYFAWTDKHTLGENFLNFFNNHLFFSIYWLVMFLDILIFTIGYTIESKYLNNVIKSVEPTLLGWAAALLCYPPFNGATGDIFGWYSQTFPSFSIPFIHITLNSLILLSFIVFVWASFTLGFKASNLTNRGIVTHGPYKFVRHPAYIAKNLARTIGVLPALILAITNIDIVKICIILFSTIGRFSLYYIRAVTEERHLGQDPDYVDYKKKVKYKFIPKIF